MMLAFNPNIHKGRNPTCAELRLLFSVAGHGRTVAAGCGGETSLNKSSDGEGSEVEVARFLKSRFLLPVQEITYFSD